jgi:hypothetical protein
MSFSPKKFLQTYGTIGILSYGVVTFVSITSMYVGLRSGVDILVPIEKVLGSDSEFVINLRNKLGETPSTATARAISTNISSNHDDNNNNNNNNSTDTRQQINWVREGTYFSIAGALDSVVIPLKLAICLPLARKILKIRGGR